MPRLKSFRRQRAWPRKGSHPAYGDFLLDEPSFWAQSAILWAMAGLEAGRFEEALHRFLPSPLRGICDIEDLRSALLEAERLGLGLEDCIRGHRSPNTPIAQANFRPLLDLLEAWRLPPAFLLPLVQAAKEAKTPEEVKEGLRFQAFTWPRSFVPVHEVEEGPKAQGVDGLDLEAPLPGKPRMQKGELRGWRPSPGQGEIGFVYRFRPDRLARMAALHLLGKTYLDIAKEELGREDLLHGDSAVRGLERKVKAFLDLALKAPNPSLPQRASPPTGLPPEDLALLRWAAGRGEFTFRDGLRSGPKALRTKDALQASLSRLVQAGLLEELGKGRYRPKA